MFKFLIAVAKDVVAGTVRKTIEKTAVKTVEKTVAKKGLRDKIFKAGRAIKQTNRVYRKYKQIKENGLKDTIRADTLYAAASNKTLQETVKTKAKIGAKQLTNQIKGDAIKTVEDNSTTAKNLKQGYDNLKKGAKNINDSLINEVDRNAEMASDKITDATVEKFGLNVRNDFGEMSVKAKNVNDTKLLGNTELNTVNAEDNSVIQLEEVADTFKNKDVDLNKYEIETKDNEQDKDELTTTQDKNELATTIDNILNFRHTNTKKYINEEVEKHTTEKESTQYFDWLVDMVRQHSGLDESYIVFNRFVSDLDDLERRSNNVLWKYIYDNISSNFVFEYTSDQTISDPEQKQITGFEDYYDKIVVLRNSYVTDGGK